MPLPGIPSGDVRLGTLGSSASGTSLSVPYPAVVKPDDFLVLNCFANVSTLYTSLGGSWTDRVRHSGTADTLAPSLYTATRQGATGLQGTNLTVTCPNVATRGRIIACPAADLASPLDNTPSSQFVDQSTAQTTNVVAAYTTTRQFVLLVGGWIDNAGAHTSTQPTNWTEQNDGDGTVSMELATFVQTLAATTGTMTNTFSGSGKSLGQVLGIKPRTLNPTLLAA